jgi:hypothetical protein
MGSLDNLKLLIVKKEKMVIPELQNIAGHNSFTALEYFLMHKMHKNQKFENEICCICQFELFEDIDKYSLEQIK